MCVTFGSYGSHSTDYLHRARESLDDPQRASLFYAALELRCGIEARLHEYIRGKEEISQRIKHGWRIAQMRRAAEELFKTDDRPMRVTLTKTNDPDARVVLYYTPVTKVLQRDGQRLGDYLHAMKEARSDDDPWWENTREFLEHVFKQLQQATQGTLMGPPLEHPEQGLQVVVEAFPPGEADFITRTLGEGGSIDILEERLVGD